MPTSQARASKRIAPRAPLCAIECTIECTDGAMHGGAHGCILTAHHKCMAGHASLPVPDYSFAGWNTHTPPWCDLQRRMIDAAARAGPWENRTDVAFFSGNLRIGGHRKYLRKLTVENRTQTAGLLRVQDVGSTFYMPGQGRAGAGAGRAAAPTVPPMSAACSYRYLISVPGFGYSNRLKALLSCGSVVIHVKAPSTKQPVSN